MSGDARVFQETEMTRTVKTALKRAIKAIRPFAALDHCPNHKITLRAYERILNLIEADKLDVRLVSRED